MTPPGLATVLADLLPPVPAGRTVALVGGGGKTSALLALARTLDPVLATTTTHLLDPGGTARVALAPALAHADGAADPPVFEGPADAPRILASARAGGKLVGIHPLRAPALVPPGGWLVVEADGSRGRPLKAPADHEPALPAGVDLVLGIVGLDALGRPLDPAHVHRPERFGPLTGCRPGEALTLDHVAALAAHPQGLFRGAPAGALRVLALNKADLADGRPAFEALRTSPALDAVLLCALGDGGRVLAAARGGRRP